MVSARVVVVEWVDPAVVLQEARAAAVSAAAVAAVAVVSLVVVAAVVVAVVAALRVVEAAEIFGADEGR